LRYRLLPYNYTLCREAHDAGLPLIRSLWLSYPDDKSAFTRGDEYVWGPDILVAPVTERGATNRRVYLPKGDWYDFWTNEKLPGGQEVTRNVDLATVPLYVRAGAILPLDPMRQYTSEPTHEFTTVRIYSGRDGTFRWYEDDGATLDYQRGQFAWTRLHWDDNTRQLTIEPDGGELKPKSRKLVAELIPSGEKKIVEYEGQRTELRF
jgi:alpha-glucosidase (family GH31 glycosyl hydrolase)